MGASGNDQILFIVTAIIAASTTADLMALNPYRELIKLHVLTEVSSNLI
jgi:hypothetical protein